MERKIIALILMLSISAAAAAGCNNNNAPEESEESVQQSENSITDTAVSTTQESTVFELDSNRYYASGSAIFMINGSEDPVFVQLPEDADRVMPESIRFDEWRTVRNGSEIIGSNADDPRIYRWVLSGGELDEKTLYDTGSWDMPVREKLDNYGGYEDVDASTAAGEIMTGMRCCIDGGDGYVYFSYVNPPEYWSEYMSLNYSVCRFPKDGGSLEFLNDDIRASSLTFYDGCLYYFDNGFRYTNEDGFSADSDKVGIYKVKPDGSEVKKLVSDIKLSDQEIDDPEYMLDHIGGRLEIVGNDLYYISGDGSGDTFLYRISVDGGEPEKVFENPCANYYVDQASGTIYYQGGTFNVVSEEGCIIYSVPISGGDSKELYRKAHAPTDRGWACVDGNYLYITDYNYFVTRQTLENGEEADNYVRSGQRFNLETNEMESLICSVEVEGEGAEMHSVGDVKAQWVVDEEDAGEDGLKTYT